MPSPVTPLYISTLGGALASAFACLRVLTPLLALRYGCLVVCRRKEAAEQGEDGTAEGAKGMRKQRGGANVDGDEGDDDDDADGGRGGNVDADVGGSATREPSDWLVLALTTVVLAVLLAIALVLLAAPTLTMRVVACLLLKQPLPVGPAVLDHDSDGTGNITDATQAATDAAVAAAATSGASELTLAPSERLRLTAGRWALRASDALAVALEPSAAGWMIPGVPDVYLCLAGGTLLMLLLTFCSCRAWLCDSTATQGEPQPLPLSTPPKPPQSQANGSPPQTPQDGWLPEQPRSPPLLPATTSPAQAEAMAFAAAAAAAASLSPGADRLHRASCQRELEACGMDADVARTVAAAAVAGAERAHRMADGAARNFGEEEADAAEWLKARPDVPLRYSATAAADDDDDVPLAESRAEDVPIPYARSTERPQSYKGKQPQSPLRPPPVLPPAGTPPQLAATPFAISSAISRTPASAPAGVWLGKGTSAASLHELNGPRSANGVTWMSIDGRHPLRWGGAWGELDRSGRDEDQAALGYVPLRRGRQPEGRGVWEEKVVEEEYEDGSDYHVVRRLDHYYEYVGSEEPPLPSSGLPTMRAEERSQAQARWVRRDTTTLH